MFVKIIIDCFMIRKVHLKIQTYKNWPHQFFRIENLPSVMLTVLAFFGLKGPFFLLIRQQCRPKTVH